MPNFPILISVYDRFKHFQQCISALQKNTLASKSNLYICSDAPHSPDAEPTINAIREYAHEITGFKKITVIERKINKGRMDNIHSAIGSIFKEYDALILIEDDIITAPGFLKFMNDCLNQYMNSPNVLSIAGYCPPIAVPDGEMDVFALNRFEPWGAGIFPRVLEIIKKRIDLDDFMANKDNKELVAYGQNAFNYMEKDARGEKTFGDMRCCYHQALTGELTIYPKQSFTQNIGFDGTGEHCTLTNKFHINSLYSKTEKFNLPKKIEINKIMQKRYQTFANTYTLEFGQIIEEECPIGLKDILISLLNCNLSLAKKYARKEQEFGLSQVILNKNRPLFIWGCGELGASIAQLFQKLNIPISGFVDSFIPEGDFKELNIENFNYKVYGPNCLKENNIKIKPVVIIASMYHNEIKISLKELGYKINADYVY